MSHVESLDDDVVTTGGVSLGFVGVGATVHGGLRGAVNDLHVSGGETSEAPAS